MRDYLIDAHTSAQRTKIARARAQAAARAVASSALMRRDVLLRVRAAARLIIAVAAHVQRRCGKARLVRARYAHSVRRAILAA